MTWDVLCRLSCASWLSTHHGRWFKADDIRRVTQELEKKDASHETCKAEQAAIWDGPIDWVWEEWEADAAWDAGPCYLNPSSVHVDDD